MMTRATGVPEYGPSRTEVEFLSGAALCRAWLFRPHPGAEPAPCIVMAHGLGGTRDAGLEPYARKFAAAGYRVLVFDYRHFGASDGEPRQLFSVGRQLQDWANAIAFARRTAGVDPDRIALWGTSFSGGHVLVAAARDGKVAAVSAQCPMTDALAAMWTNLRYAGLGGFLRLGLLGAADQLRALLRLPPLYIPLIAPPGQTAAMSSHDSATGFGALVPPHWRNAIAARYCLTIGTYRPVSVADRVPCPTLLQVCLRDSLLPAASAFATATRMGDKAELRRYDCGHFDIYTGDHFERASSDQLDFFNRTLMGVSGGGTPSSPTSPTEGAP